MVDKEKQLKVLTISSLYPNNVKPTFGIFVENRLLELVHTGKIDSKVIAPVAHFPLLNKVSAQYKASACIKTKERRNNVDVLHPRYLHFPVIGMLLQPFLLALTLYISIKKLLKKGWACDVIDAHFFYPDGVAAMLVGKWLKKPVVITARGTDINEYTKLKLPRMMIKWAANNASKNITVSDALNAKLCDVGVSVDKVTTLRNGVDLNKFTMADNLSVLRSRLGLKKTTIVSVGNLVELKGHRYIIEAMTNIPNAELYIFGDGPLEAELKAVAKRADVNERVFFCGRLGQAELIERYQSADVLVLASSREGWPNVLLESLACGTPVVATNVGGCPEVLKDPMVGKLCNRTVAHITECISELLDNLPSKTACRIYAESFSWNETTEEQLAIFNQSTGQY